MNVYLASLFVTIIVNSAIKNSRMKTIQKKQWMLILALIIWGSIMFLRGESVGTDTSGYQNLFAQIASVSWRDLPREFIFRRCPLYVVAIKLLTYISISPQMITFFNAFVYLIGVLAFLYCNSVDFAFSIYGLLGFHYYFYAMNASRMSIAIVLVLWSYHFGIRGKKTKSILFFMVGVLVHNVAIVGIIVMALSWIKVDRIKAYITMWMSVVILSKLKEISILFGKILPSYAAYTDIANGGIGGSGRRWLIALFLIMIFVLCQFWVTVNKTMLKDDEEYWRLSTICIIALISMIIWRNVYIFARIEFFFNYFFLIYIPHCYEKVFTLKSRRIMYVGTEAVLFVPFYIKLVDYLPYIPYWSF